MGITGGVPIIDANMNMTTSYVLIHKIPTLTIATNISPSISGIESHHSASIPSDFRRYSMEYASQNKSVFHTLFMGAAKKAGIVNPGVS